MSEETNNKNETHNIVGEIIVKAVVPALVTVVGILVGARK